MYIVVDIYSCKYKPVIRVEDGELYLFSFHFLIFIFISIYFLFSDLGLGVSMMLHVICHSHMSWSHDHMLHRRI